MRDKQNKEIDGITYACKPLPGWDGIELFFELVGVLGEPAAAIITRALSEESIGDADAGELIGAGVYTFFSKLDAQNGMRIMQIVFREISVIDKDTKNATPLGEERNFNHHFTGDTLAAIKVFWWGLEVNYQRFLGDGRISGPVGILVAAVSKAFSPSTSPPPSQPSSSAQTEASA